MCKLTPTIRENPDSAKELSIPDTKTRLKNRERFANEVGGSPTFQGKYLKRTHIEVSSM